MLLFFKRKENWRTWRKILVLRERTTVVRGEHFTSVEGGVGR
jgi:hypothetical protein